MKFLLCFMFLIQCCYCADEIQPSKDKEVGYVDGGGSYAGPAIYDSQTRDDNQYRNYQQNGDYQQNGNYQQNGDYQQYSDYQRYLDYQQGDDKEDQDGEKRPCATHDVDCIRHALSVITGCRPTYGPAPEPYYFKHIPLNFPRANVSSELYGVQVKGLNSGKIAEFYIDKKTDTLVFEVEYKSLVVYSPKTVADYHRKGKAPSRAVDYTKVEFKDLSFTLSIEHIRDMSKSNNHVYAYLSGPIIIEAGPKILSSEAFRSVLTNLSVTAREALVTYAPLYMAVYLRSKICDFGYY